MHFNQIAMKFVFISCSYSFSFITCTCLFHKSLFSQEVNQAYLFYSISTAFPLHKEFTTQSPLINYCLKMNEHKKCISKYIRHPTDPKNSHKINLKTYWTSTEGKQRKQTFLSHFYQTVQNFGVFISIANKKK